MKFQYALRNVIRTIALAGLVCMLPVFSNKVMADTDPEIYKANGTTLATKGEDYTIETDYVSLKKDNLIICSPAKNSGEKDLPFVDCCDSSELHTFTISGLTMSVEGNYAFGFTKDNPVELYVEGKFNNIYCASEACPCIEAWNSLKVLPKGDGAKLSISGNGTGISMYNSSSSAGLILGGNDKSLEINTNTYKEALCCDESWNRIPLKINKGVTLRCENYDDSEEVLVDNFSNIYINGNVWLKNSASSSKSAIILYGSTSDDFKIGPYADISLGGSMEAAIKSNIPQELTEELLGATMSGYTEGDAPSNFPLIHFQDKMKITASENGNLGYSRYLGIDGALCQAVIIKGIRPEPVFYDENDENSEALVDHDTFKSEVPSKTVIATDEIDAQTFFDLKVYSANEKTQANQKLLAQYLIGANAQILLTENIYPRRDLSLTENGSAKILIWNNLSKNQAGPINAVVYNQIDGAYVISGILDANGTAIFTGFKLRPASTITICK